MAATPLLIKMAALATKTVTKPVAKVIKSRAAVHPSFKKFCMGVGQSRNHMMYWMNRLSGQKSKFHTIDESSAVYYGSELLSEMIVFSVAGGLLYGEYQWKAEQDREKKRQQEEEKRLEREEIRDRLQIIEDKLDALEENHKGSGFKLW